MTRKDSVLKGIVEEIVSSTDNPAEMNENGHGYSAFRQWQFLIFGTGVM